MKITTKSGDGGESGLFGGARRSKGDAVFGVLGDLDELNAVIGWCKVCVGGGKVVVRVGGVVDVELEGGGTEGAGKTMLYDGLERVQDDVYRIMAIVGSEGRVSGVKEICAEDVAFLEEWMEEFAEVVEGMREFVRPGDGELSARLHVARTVCRRAERGVVGYFEGVGGWVGGDNGGASVEILKYMNRLSDLLFVLACACGES